MATLIECDWCGFLVGRGEYWASSLSQQRGGGNLARAPFHVARDLCGPCGLAAKTALERAAETRRASPGAAREGEE